MENLDLGKYQDVAILGRRNIPYLLRCVGQMPYELIPGDDVFKFRSRAKKLLDKWKPSILRDSLASPYIWRYGRGASTSRMFCHRSIDETANEENAEKIWKYLIGQYTP
ncbi:hypothetical protein EST38_g8564 [Candolleomyces aberdarensis]|uniref:Uncharacterized protein n=1 Tax=Candolleomyces aberdarensis TaxID=2316362 RepID=A0A4V1Q343_9AGAR|nr:hypothetical protein EST38_g8564 [Candolleomyces aberdarensis]